MRIQVRMDSGCYGGSGGVTSVLFLMANVGYVMVLETVGILGDVNLCLKSKCEGKWIQRETGRGCGQPCQSTNSRALVKDLLILCPLVFVYDWVCYQHSIKWNQAQHLVCDFYLLIFFILSNAL